jgi:asparagine synthase (glutamine-hydrolysing)
MHKIVIYCVRLRQPQNRTPPLSILYEITSWFSLEKLRCTARRYFGNQEVISYQVLSSFTSNPPGGSQMCGIVGSIGLRSSGPLSAQTIASIGHRGPDSSGQIHLHRTGSAGQGSTRLGHLRLSIIDLEGGLQPMTDARGLVTIVFNGEIYNFLELRRELESLGHVFQRRSDTEVILEAYLEWGTAAFARLRGMFAVALYDHRRDETVLARDAFGIKPLFYLERSGELLFASEIAGVASMMGSELKLDMSSVFESLTQRYPVGKHTLYQDIKRLEPGTVMVVRPDGNVRSRERFVKLEDLIESHREHLSALPYAALKELTRERVEDSAMHHMIADVDLGCFLSGGLDSSIVASLMAARTGKKINAYSIGFDGQSESSELPFAREAAQRAGVNLTEILLCAEDFNEIMPKLSGTLNGPFSEPADVAMYRLSQVAAQDVKVVLSGEGADESFAGYPKYAFDGLANRYGWAARLGRGALGRKSRLGIAADALAEPDPVRRWRRWFANDTVPTGLLRALEQQGVDTDRAERWTRTRTARYPSTWTNLQRMQLLDLESWLPNNLLHRGDYTTMQSSLEQRVPLLDLELTPWAIALPNSAKIKRMTGKAVLRDAFRDQLPNSVLERAKSGFRLPLGEWLRHNKQLSSLLHDHLEANNAQLRTWLGGDDLSAITSQQALSSTGGAKLAWTALGLELWLKSVAKVSATPVSVAAD